MLCSNSISSISNNNNNNSSRGHPDLLLADDRPFCQPLRLISPNTDIRLTCSPRIPPDTTVIGETVCSVLLTAELLIPLFRRFSDYPLPGFDRSKSLAAAQQQQQSRNMTIGQSPMHFMGSSSSSSAGHRQQVTSSASPGSRHHIAHHVYEADSESVPKRPRLITEPKASLHQPLHIDTRDVHEIHGKKVT
jgi:hypothetical protein